MRRAVTMGMVVATTACGAASSDGTSTRADDQRVPVEVYLDLTSTVPDDVAGLDLGSAVPRPDSDFCSTWSQVPTRWLDDAVVPLQHAVDSFGAARAGVPDEVLDDWDRLLEFGVAKLEWNFKRREERPVWSAAEAEMALRIADTAVATCPDLPIAMGPPERWAQPPGWDDLSSEEIRANCDAALGAVAAGIEWYEDELGATPSHQEQIELAANVVIYRSIDETGDWPSGVMYVASDFVGIGADGVPAAVPGGACDL